MSPNGFYSRYGKRMLDLTLAIPLLLAVLPVMGLIAVCVRLKLGRPVLFRQTRPGYRARPFVMCKFRTMTDACDARGRLLPDERRLTAFGRWLRSTSLDELPELWHVLRGDMSLVGPRPLLMSYLDRYTPAEARRHDVLPGLTGWAQINGRNAIDWDARLALDVWYVEHLSLRLDLAILLRTVAAVLRRSDISQPGHATVQPLRPQLQQPATPQTPDVTNGIVVIGAGGHAKVVVATLQAAGRAVSAVLDDNPARWGDLLLGVPISGPVDSIRLRIPCRAIIAVGDNSVRRQIAERWRSVEWINVVHPSAIVHATVALGPGSIICAGAVVQPDARIGAHAIVNTSASVDHDATVGDYAHVAPGVRLAGQVRIGDGALIGIGASVTPGVSIGSGSIVGAGSVVVHDIPERVVAMGIPARVTRRSTSSVNAA